MESWRNWKQWLRSLTPVRRWAPLSLIAAYGCLIAAVGQLHSEHLGIGFAIVVLSYSGPTASKILSFLLPLFLTGIVYDSQRYYEDLIRGPVHVIEPYLFDKTFFGIHVGQAVLTPNEWWQQHTYWALDAITGFFYLTFIGLFVLTAAYFRLNTKIGRRLGMDPEAYARRAQGLMWAFFWVNVLGYSTYYWYSAAPPWYVSLYGLGPARMDVLPNPAGCVRFDQLFGTHVFSGFYSKSADVFGAVPSLHVAYPLLAFLYALEFRSARAWCLTFYAMMCFSAIYLNHHYMLDILWGSIYAVGVMTAVDAYFVRIGRRGRRAATDATFEGVAWERRLASSR